jgi:hypothetical protein
MTTLPPVVDEVFEFPKPQSRFARVDMLVSAMRTGYYAAYPNRVEGRDFHFVTVLARDGQSGHVRADSREVNGEVNIWVHEMIEFNDLTPVCRRLLKIPTSAEWIV